MSLLMASLWLRHESVCDHLMDASEACKVELIDAVRPCACCDGSRKLEAGDVSQSRIS